MVLHMGAQKSETCQIFNECLKSLKYDIKKDVLAESICSLQHHVEFYTKKISKKGNDVFFHATTLLLDSKSDYVKKA